MRRITRTTASTLLPLSLSLSLIPPTSCSVAVDFSAYPSPTQPCLSQAASASGCSSSQTVYDENDCLCSNSGNFVLATATCLGGDDATDDELYATQVYDLMDENCLDTATPLSVSRSEFQDALLGTTETGPVESSSSAMMTGGETVTAQGGQGNGNGRPGDSLPGMMAAIVMSFAVLLAASGVIALLYVLYRRRKMSRAAAAAAAAAVSRLQDWRGDGLKGGDMKLSIDTENLATANKGLDNPTIEDEKAAARSAASAIHHQEEVHFDPSTVENQVRHSPDEPPGQQHHQPPPDDGQRVIALTLRGPRPGDGGTAEPWSPSPLSATPSSSIDKNGYSPIRPVGQHHLPMALPQVTASHAGGPGRSGTPGFNQEAPFELAGDARFHDADSKASPSTRSRARVRTTLDTRVQRWISTINMARSPI